MQTRKAASERMRFLFAVLAATVFGKIEFRKYIQNQIKNGNLVRIKNRSLLTSESTSPINADYDMDASEDSIRNQSEEVKQNSDISSEPISNRTLLANALVLSPTIR